ncbi:MAG: Doxorubicin resistance ATP-binding protein DrrA [Chlamydiae bacterium]|nr:Doxorubicin resistance ATP-binding protein DrrA [Chlamydiota bacterium]
MSQYLLEVKDVTKVYGKKKHARKALDHVSLDIYEGEILGLLGVNGAGKTTLSSIIATLVKLTSGDVLWKGESIYKDLIAYRKQVGLCPQRPNLDRLLNVEETLYYSGRFYGLSKQEAVEKKEELLKWFELQEYRTDKVDQLSGGYKQRFLIARTLMHSPQLVILDEPTVGLDPHIRHHLWDVIRTLKANGITVILTTHYLDEAQLLSDRVVIIDSGKIKLVDTPQNLMTRYNKKNLEDVFLQLQEEDTE